MPERVDLDKNLINSLEEKQENTTKGNENKIEQEVKKVWKRLKQKISKEGSTDVNWCSRGTKTME